MSRTRPARRPASHVVKIAPGGLGVSQDEDALLVTVLGSCVSACLRDPEARVGGMNHFMLPESACGRWHDEAGSARYGNFAMDQLIEAIERQGGRKERLEAKLFGGATTAHDGTAIGTRNAQFAESYLLRRGIVPLARDLGGTLARRLAYAPASGRAFVAMLGQEEKAPPGQAALPEAGEVACRTAY